MSAPRWALWLVTRLAPPAQAADVAGDLAEAHRGRLTRRGRVAAWLLTALEALDVSAALVRARLRRRRVSRARGRPHRRPIRPSVSWLDFRLGFRMLVKHPGLTVVGGLAMAFAIAVGGLAFEVGLQLTRPTLPLPDAERVVAFRLWHTAAGGVEEQALYDYRIWREQLASVDALGAYRDVDRSLGVSGGQVVSVRVAEISASAFEVAPVRPLLGRPLLEADERPGAPPVLVLGERLWRTHFAANPDVIGRTVGLGAGRSTIVGVLPASFAFPTHHRAWAPLRVEALATGPREGSPIGVFGRLAPGVSLAEAQAELSALGGRTAAASPATHEHIRPEVMPYARAVLPVSWATVLGVASGMQLAVLLFLVMLCVNVATLVFARTSARENEIVVRSALGASRARIATQVLAETLVLGAIAAIIGVGAASVCARFALTAYETFARSLPFWVHADLSATTVLYAVFLTVLGSVIAGVVPALKVTRGLAGGLRASAVGGASLRFGRVWQGLIVVQVALTMIFMAVALDTLRDAGRARRLAFGFPAGQHLTAIVQMHRETAASETAEVPYTDDERARFRTTFQALRRRLAAEPDVAAVTYAQTFPGTFHDLQRIQVEGAVPSSSAPLPLVEIGSVGVDFFAALGLPVLAGRGFHPADIPVGPPRCTGCDQLSDAIVVNETLARRLFGGRGAVGRRVRFVDARNADRWHEIVGVVGDIAMNGDPMLLRRLQGGGIYRAWAPGATYSAGISVRVRGAPEDFVTRFRAVTAAVDPSIRLSQVVPLPDLHDETVRMYTLWSRIAFAAAGIVLLLSVAGTYSMMAFSVSRRTREIGIRAALGGSRPSIVATIVRRAFSHVLLGMAIGGAVVAFYLVGGAVGPVEGGFGVGLTARGVSLLVASAGVMLGVWLLACITPARRALRIDPARALNADL